MPAVEALETRTLFAVYALDPTFGDGGRAGIVGPIIDAWTPQVVFVETLPDGKILAGGSLDVTGAAVARLNPSGTRDTSFSGDGISAIVPMDYVIDGAMQADGKVLLVGGTSAGMVVARFNTDGT